MSQTLTHLMRVAWSVDAAGTIYGCHLHDGTETVCGERDRSPARLMLFTDTPASAAQGEHGFLPTVCSDCVKIGSVEGCVVSENQP